MIERSTNIAAALRSRQRGFLLNPFRFASSGPVDPHWSNVVLLLHGEGSNGSTVIVDSSSSAKTVAANGGASISTTDPLYGSSSIRLPSGGYLQAADSPDFAFGSGEFAVELAARFNANPISSSGDYGITLIGQTALATSNRAWFIFITGTSLSNCAVRASVYSGGTEYRAEATGVNLALNTKHNFAMARVGSTLRLFINGAVSGTRDVTGVTVSDAAQPLMIGRFNDATYPYFIDGDIDEVRITKGVGRYSASYSPATTPFPNS